MEKHFNPEMLVLARESRAFTQGDVAEKLKITQSLISKIEHGVSSPTDEILVIISAILHYPRDFFFQPDPVYGLGVSFLFHRKRQTMPAADLRVIQAKVNILRMRVERLLRGVEMVSPYTFTPIDIHDHSMRRDGPEHIAGLVRAAWQLPSGPVRNLVSAIENAGGIVFSYPFGHRKVDAISLWVTGSPPLFFVNSELPGERQRFTLAHELGHVIMHRVPNENIEEEADRFAAAFLMPETDSRMDLQRLTLSRAAALKPYWKVSMAAIVRRAKDVRGISPETYKRLNIELGMAGYKTHEPLPIPAESPSLLSKLVKAYTEDRGFTVEQLGMATFSYVDEFRSQFMIEPSQQLRLAT